MEATRVYWKTDWYSLSDDEFALVLANAGHVKNVPEHKTAVNAVWLSELMTHGFVKASFVPDQPNADTAPRANIQRQPPLCARPYSVRYVTTMPDVMASIFTATRAPRTRAGTNFGKIHW
jgi:hypothetical protein